MPKRSTLSKLLATAVLASVTTLSQAGGRSYPAEFVVTSNLPEKPSVGLPFGPKTFNAYMPESVKPGQSSTLIVTLKNVGEGTGSLKPEYFSHKDITLSGDTESFGVTHDCTDISVGKECSLTIKFTPKAEGQKRAWYKVDFQELVLLGSAYGR